MIGTYLILLAVGAICGALGMYFYFEAKYIDQLDQPIIHTLTIQVEEETNGKDNQDSDATRWLDSWRG